MHCCPVVGFLFGHLRSFSRNFVIALTGERGDDGAA
jgi:hypothetical protein